jgi:hypothetical protein
VDRQKTLERLNSEKKYEEQLADRLYGYFQDCLPGIDDMTEKQKKQTESILKLVAKESRIHSTMITKLIDQVLESAEDIF